MKKQKSEFGKEDSNIKSMSGYTEWRKNLWKLAVKHPAKLNKRQNRARLRLAYRIRQAILKSYEDY